MCKDLDKINVLNIHVMEETKNIIKLHSDNKISLMDAAFYYHRLHDFNTDGFLDGLELLRALQHSHMHADNKTHSDSTDNLETYADAVDNQLSEIDANNDGLIEYAEFASYLGKNMREESEKRNT
ncbi:EF hand domain-containing protein-like protein [Leptotrombidium deliense]|uniref:EF hand domain-containing protein-like protein n=1 Tax=Leptotrombidium deliense TaxID=299467 RepID=A0A443RXM0_9ACAR|nr:EF hand domain-containing protein-like protein [Leptotrombidium deliense]